MAQAPAKPAFRAAHYEVDAILEPTTQSLSARARVELEVLEPSRIVTFELHPNLTVRQVTDAKGGALSFDRELEAPLRLRVTLAQMPAANEKVSLAVEYGGPFTSAENSPTRDVRLAYVGEDTAFLLREARWFPLMGFPGNRFTGVFRINVPDTMAVVGTGKSEAPTVATPAPPPAKPGAGGTQPQPAAPAGSRVLYTFRVEEPSSAGTFVAGNLQLTPVRSENLSVSVFTRPADAQAAATYGQAVAAMVTYFSAQLGSLPQPNLTVVQLPDFTVPAAAAPGLILVSHRRWEAEPNQRLLAELVAQQWWGSRVLPATGNDVWLSDGLARYSGAMYLQESNGEAGFNSALDSYAVGALMYEDAAPIAQAARLEPFSSEYRSVVANKGAMVFHMLRHQVGEEAFRNLLREFYAKYVGRTATLDDFRALAQEVAQRNMKEGETLNLTPFFTQWLNSTGVPEFKLEYVVYRTQKGFRVIGKIKQDLETFRMTAGLRIDTEGNPEFKTIEIRGTDSDFSVETFGRPKPNGIVLDPQNQLLKSSPTVRVRAAIARGEELAEASQFFEAIQHYQNAITLSKNSSLAHFRMGEAMFFQKNPQAAANAFRNALEGDLDPKWIQVWCHIYLGKIFDLAGLRERAVNEYNRALELNDDTGGARAEAQKYIQTPYKEEARPANAQ